MRSDLLWVASAYANPYRWQSRLRLARKFCAHMVASGVRLIVVETQHGDRPFELDDISGIIHVPTRAHTMAWSKESQINVARHSLPPDAEYFAWIDMDVEFRRENWAAATVHALQLWPVVQPWTEVIDHDARGLASRVKGQKLHHSFAWVWREYGDVLGWNKQSAKPASKIITERHRHHHHYPPPPPPYGLELKDHTEEFERPLDLPEGLEMPPPYAHPGLAWAARIDFLDRVGWLLDRSGIGAGDHQMSMGLIGKIDRAVPVDLPTTYSAYVRAWGERAFRACQGHIGYVPGRIEHGHHGNKDLRQYAGRWEILKRHNFDPLTDYHQNRWGILELSDNKPEFRRDVERYFASRDEDSIGGPY